MSEARKCELCGKWALLARLDGTDCWVCELCANPDRAALVLSYQARHGIHQKPVQGAMLAASSGIKRKAGKSVSRTKKAFGTSLTSGAARRRTQRARHVEGLPTEDVSSAVPGAYALRPPQSTEQEGESL